MMGNYYGYGFGNFYGFGWIVMVIFWVLVVWGIIALVRGAFWSGHSGFNRHLERPEADKSMSILKERYAKGDISKEEFEEKKSVLMK